MKTRIFFSLFLLLLNFPVFCHVERKLLICGVGKNVAPASYSTIKNIEALGKRFSDYRVIIYENNSEDRTAANYAAWAKRNPKVTFLTEVIPFDKMPAGRMAKIAHARNALLEEMQKSQYEGFDVVVMADLDFMTPWPIDAIVRSTQVEIEWDAISANGIDQLGCYYDRIALRSEEFPLGPELLGDMLWMEELKKPQKKLSEKEWIPTFSAFGGLALYKKKTLVAYRYSGKVTEAVERYYRTILTHVSPSNPQISAYLSHKKMNPLTPISNIKLIFSSKQCCEHLTMHAQMALDGHGKFFINPDMVMRY